jgi:hypothetical protein
MILCCTWLPTSAGFAVVKRGRDKKTNESVAIKVRSSKAMSKQQATASAVLHVKCYIAAPGIIKQQLQLFCRHQALTLAFSS